MSEILPVTVSNLKDEGEKEAISGDVSSSAPSAVGGDSPNDQGIFDNETIRELDFRISENSGVPLHGMNRQPFIFTRVAEREAGVLIYASLNPTEISYTVPLREVLEKCGGGEVKHTAEANLERAENLGRFIGEIDVQYTLTTGNCLPIRFQNGQLGIPKGLATFHELSELLLESDRVLPDGRPNDMIVIQNSITFPSLTLEGKVKPEGISWSESAESPTVIGYSFTLSVHHTFPKLTKAQALASNWDWAAPRIGKI